jgi:hypothetical protein
MMRMIQSEILTLLLAVKTTPRSRFHKPCTIIYVRECTTNTGTLPSTRTSDV